MKSKINKIIKIAFITLIILTTLVMSFVSVNAVTENQLRIKSIDVYVNEDKVSTSSDIEVYHGDIVKLLITLENRYSDDDDIKILDAYVELDCDNDWDFADGEDSDEEDIREDDTEVFEIEFEIDEDDIDDEEIEMKILAYGEDEENSSFTHEDEDSLDFIFLNPEDAVKIDDFRFSENPVDCSKNFVYFNTTIWNYGSNDLDDVEIKVFSDADNLDYYGFKSFELKDRTKEDFSFQIPIANKEGVFKFQIGLYNDNYEEEYFFTYLTVTCSNNNNQNDNTDDDETNDNEDDNDTNGNDDVNDNNNEEEDEEEIILPGAEDLDYQKPIPGNHYPFSFWTWLKNIFSFGNK